MIEDNKQVLRILAFAVGREGYQIIQASDGLTGLRLAKERIPDLVLIDLTQTKLGSFETCVELRKAEIEAPIILLFPQRNKIMGYQRLRGLFFIIIPEHGGRGDRHMTSTERRQRILEVLCIRRHDTCDNLAHEFHVSNATIRRDIGVLMCLYPVETVCGRYGGGVKIADTYYPYRKTLNKKQIALLTRLSTQLDGNDLAIISSIIFQLAP